jgi:hypothetical protein
MSKFFRSTADDSDSGSDSDHEQQNQRQQVQSGGRFGATTFEDSESGNTLNIMDLDDLIATDNFYS